MSGPGAGVRLQKYLAECGLASRRKAEEIIQSGRVRVNGRVVTELGTRVSPGRDLVVVDGAPVEPNAARRYILLYKPPGCVTTLSDPQGRPTARGYLAGVKERVFPVGRLDYDAEGALLFTDDGELANRLAHPSFGHKRVYLVKTKGDPDPAALRRLVDGVRLEDGPARALAAEIHERAEKNTWVKLVVGEGRNHLVKRLCEAVGLPVLRLFRPEFGGVTVQRLRSGHWRDLSAEEVALLRRSAGAAPGEPGRNPIGDELPKAARRHGHGPPPQRGAGEARSGGHPAGEARFDARSARDGRPGQHGQGHARHGQHGQGHARHGQHGTGEARPGQHGTGEARPGQRGTGEARAGKRGPVTSRTPPARRPGRPGRGGSRSGR